MNLNLPPLHRQMLLRSLTLLILLVSLLTGCALPQVKAEDRLFLGLSLDFLGAYELPQTVFSGIPVKGFSGITYDRQRDRFYALSKDSRDAPARFYTLNLNLGSTLNRGMNVNVETQSPGSHSSLESATLGNIQIGNVVIEKVTTLTGEEGEPYPAEAIAPGGIDLSPRQSVFISSEGIASRGVAPFIGEFDLSTGQLKLSLSLPDPFIPQIVDDQVQGIQDNLGLTALALGATSALEPFRLFTATEAALAQDRDEPDSLTQPIRTRVLHYLIGERFPLLLAEHLYLLDSTPEGTPASGLAELLTLDQAGHFLSLERSLSPNESAQLFQFVIGAATDIASFANLKGDISGIQPVRKRLLLNLGELGISFGQPESMTLGPQLPDGSQSLLLVNNIDINDNSTSQFLLFRLSSGK
jgi:hypothetical protein